MASPGFTTSILEFLEGCPCANLLASTFAARTFIASEVAATLNQGDPRSQDLKLMDSQKDGENYFDWSQVGTNTAMTVA